MYHNLRSFIRLTVNQKTIFVTKHQLDPVVHIDKSYPGTMLWYFIVILEDIFNCLLTHTHAIILDREIDIISLFLAAYRNHAAVILVHISNPIIDCIFQDRLYDELDRTAIIDFLVNIKFHAEPFFIAHKLDIHIAPAVLQLIRDPDYGSSL